MGVMSEMDLDRQAIRGIGDNGPPSPVESAREATTDLGRFLSDNPVIENQDRAKTGTLYVERVRKTLQDLEAARKEAVKPHNDKVKHLNLSYGNISRPLETILHELRYRLTDYAGREEAKRIAVATEKRRLAELAEMEARVAEQRERDAKSNATIGEITDVAAAVIEADTKFQDYQRADRVAAVAERSTSVRFASQLGGKALSLRTKETLVLDDAFAALRDIGVTDKIKEAILSAARDYRRLHEKLPAGVSAELKREI